MNTETAHLKTDANIERGEACIAARRRLQAGALDIPLQMRASLAVLLDDAAHAFEAAAGGYRFSMGEDRRFGNMYYLAESIPSPRLVSAAVSSG